MEKQRTNWIAFGIIIAVIGGVLIYFSFIDRSNLKIVSKKIEATVSQGFDIQKGYVEYDADNESLYVNTANFVHTFTFEEKLNDLSGMGLGIVKDELGDVYMMGFMMSSTESFERAIQGEDIKPYIILKFGYDSNMIFGYEFKIEGNEALKFIQQGIQGIFKDRNKVPSDQAKQLDTTEPVPDGKKETNRYTQPLPKNTVRFEITGQGVVDCVSYTGYIDLDTLKNEWNFYLGEGAITGLTKWNNNPYNMPNLFRDKNEVDYIIEPMIYNETDPVYYIGFFKNEAGGSELRISKKTALQYLKAWH